MISTINLGAGREEEWKLEAIMTRMHVIYWEDNKFHLMFNAPKLNDSKLKKASAAGERVRGDNGLELSSSLSQSPSVSFHPPNMINYTFIEYT